MRVNAPSLPDGFVSVIPKDVQFVDHPVDLLFSAGMDAFFALANSYAGRAFYINQQVITSLFSMSEVFRLSILVLALVGLIVILLILLGHFINKRHLPSTPADVALVFGTGLAWKAQTRWTTAAHLFQRGLVRYIITSGGVIVPGIGITEAEWFRAHLMEHGVPAERILIEERATNTAENTEFALPIIKEHNFQTVILVMSDFEGIRAHLTAKKYWRGQGIKIYDYHASSIGHWSPWSWWLTREGCSLTWYTVPRLFRYRLWKYLWRTDIAG